MGTQWVRRFAMPIVGYAQKPEAALEKMAENRIWKVSVRSKRDPHRVAAANVKDADGQLVFTDVQGNLVGSFRGKDVQGYSVESDGWQFLDSCV